MISKFKPIFNNVGERNKFLETNNTTWTQKNKKEAKTEHLCFHKIDWVYSLKLCHRDTLNLNFIGNLYSIFKEGTISIPYKLPQK